MTRSESKECVICGAPMSFIEYRGDWAVWECSKCGSEAQESVGNPTDEGFTMESLGRVSDYVESED